MYVHHWNRCMLGNDTSLMQQVFCKMPGEYHFKFSQAHVTGQVTSTADFGGHVSSAATQTCSIGDKSGDIAGQGSTLTLFWIKKSVTTSATCGRALSCCSVVLCCCSNGRTWGHMIWSQYLMPVSVPSTRAVLLRDEIQSHPMTLPPPKGHH